MDRVVGDGGVTSTSTLSATRPSGDDRLTFSDGVKPGGDVGGGMPHSDWLMAGETALVGTIDSIAAENRGRSGPVVVNEGVFRTRLLCPSQVRAWLPGSREGYNTCMLGGSVLLVALSCWAICAGSVIKFRHGVLYLLPTGVRLKRKHRL